MKRRNRTKERKEKESRYKKIGFSILLIPLIFYFGGFLERLSHSVVVLNPFVCIWKGITTATGLQSSVVACLGMLLLGMLIIWRGKEKIFQKQMNGTLIIP